MGLLQQINQIDHQLFLYLNGFHNTFFDYLMTVFTYEAFWVPFYLVTAFVIAHKYGKKSIIFFVFVGLLILCTDQFAGIFKHSIQRLRPSHDPILSPITHIFFNKGGLYSFYSAHSSNAFAFATFTALLFRRRVFSLFIFPWALLVAYTRIYLGLHFPGDILCGAIAGIAIAFGIYKLMIYTQQKYFSSSNLVILPLNNKEISIIEISALIIVIIAMMIVNLFLKNNLVITG